MPAPLAARGIIITVSVLAAAAMAAYENELVRAWIDGARQRIAVGLHSLGDEIQPKRRVPETQRDASMSEEKGDAAEERRRQARAEILERGRILEERRRRRKSSTNTSTSNSKAVDTATSTATAAEPVQAHGTLRSRRSIPVEADVQPSSTVAVTGTGIDTAEQSFETAYEREMRTSWNLTLPPARSPLDAASTHASESLLDLTPTTEDCADPDYSVPLSPSQPRAQAGYFPPATGHLADPAPEYYYAHPSRPLEPVEPRQASAVHPASTTVSSAAASVAGSSDLVHASEADMSEDDLLSEPDGIRTPASAWTDVESTVSQSG